MSEQLTANLLAALRQSPDNVELRMVVLRMLLEHGPAGEIAPTVAPLTPAKLGSAADRRTVAEAHRRGAQATAALGFLELDTEPETQLLRARVLLELGRHEDGRGAYASAIAANAALEDADLRRSLARTCAHSTARARPR